MDNTNIVKALISLVIGVVLLVLLRYFFKRILKKSDKIHRRFLGYLSNLIVFIVCMVTIVEFIYPGLKMYSLLLKGSALFVAIIGFAAQPAIADLICGFLISMNKPFEIGDRIEVEGLEPGIVEDITLRHTVLRIYDNIRIVVPNSVLNSKTVTNMSYRSERRGIHLKYSVSYDTDVHKAMDIIRDCVVASPYTLPVETNGIMEDSGPVYFLEFGDSALILETTIWVLKDTNTQIATTDVNMRVNNAFRKYGIEIPYAFVNVVERENTVNDDVAVRAKKTTPSKRHYRSDTVNIIPKEPVLENALEVVRHFASVQRFGEQESGKIELMSEELIGVMGGLLDDVKGRFWVEGSGVKYRIHLRILTTVGSQEYRKLIALSSSGRNEAAHTFAAKIWDKVVAGMKSADSSSNSSGGYEWSLRENGENDDLGESILVSLADDIKVSVTKEQVELVIVKTVKL